jgi:hypothetical protein
MLLASFLPAMAAGTVVVTPTNTQGWSTADTRPGGAVNYVADATAPAGTAALQLTTDATTAAKAQYMHDTLTPLSEVTELSYYAKQNSASFAQGQASYQLAVMLNGNAGGFTTMVFEPYENVSQGAVIPGAWQQWDVDAGQFWSSRSVTCSNGAVVAGAGGAPFYTLSQLQTMCPDAAVVQFGVNVGSFNPSYDVETDLVSFNDTAYDFELANVPASKDDCKKDGYLSLTDANGQPFRNQGQCVSYFNHL